MSTIILDPVAVARIEREHGITLTDRDRYIIMRDGRTLVRRQDGTRVLIAIPTVRYPDDIIDRDIELPETPWG